MLRGGRQGGVETPWLWRTLLAYVLDPVVQKWQQEGQSWQVDGVSFDAIVWAGNIYVLPHTPQGVSSKAVDVSDALRKHGMGLKPDELQWIHSGAAPVPEGYELRVKDVKGQWMAVKASGVSAAWAFGSTAEPVMRQPLTTGC